MFDPEKVERIDADWCGYRLVGEGDNQAKTYVHGSDYDQLLALYREFVPTLKEAA